MLKYEKYFKYAKYVFVAAPALACLFMVLRYGVNTVIGDEWIMVHYGEKVQAGTFTFADLWLPWNEHRQFFFKLAYLAVAFLTKFNSRAQMMVSFALVCAGYFFVIKYLFSKVKAEIWRCAGGFALGLLMFSPVQYENFLWGVLLAYFMAGILPVISSYFLYRRISTGKRRYLAFAIALGVVASFSSLQGLLVWPAALAMLVLHYRKAVFRQSVFFAWLAAGAASWFFYFFKLYEQAPGGTIPFRDNFLHILKHPFFFLQSMARMAFTALSRVAFTVLLGKSSLSVSLFSLLCFFAAVCAVAVCGFRLVTRYDEDGFFPGAVALFGIMSVAAVSFGRSIWWLADVSRYTTATLLIYVGALLYALVSRDMPKKEPAEARKNREKLAMRGGGRLLKHAAAALMLAIVLASAISWPEGFVACQIVRERNFVSYTATLKEYKTAPDMALLLQGPPRFGDTEAYTAQKVRELARQVRELASFLEENGYSVFAGQPIS